MLSGDEVSDGEKQKTRDWLAKAKGVRSDLSRPCALQANLNTLQKSWSRGTSRGKTAQLPEGQIIK